MLLGNEFFSFKFKKSVYFTPSRKHCIAENTVNDQPFQQAPIACLPQDTVGPGIE
jgi:hypothetical protein